MTTNFQLFSTFSTDKCILKINLSLFCILLLFLSTGQSQDDFISIKKQQKDIKELVKIIEAHPDPYAHTSKEDFKERISTLTDSIIKPVSILDFYKKVSSIIALIKDGHSSTYMPKDWLKNQRRKFGVFPYEVHLTNENELFIIKDYVGNGIPLRSKIETINGITVDQFIKRIDPFISYELSRFRNTLIDGSFEFYLYLAFNKSTDTVIEYTSGETQTVTVKNMDFNTWEIQQKDEKSIRDKMVAKSQPYAYKSLGKGIGSITIYAFRAPSLKSYKLFLAETFKTIKKEEVHSIIIDLRGNFGGWPKISSELFHYISDSYFKTLAKSTLKVSAPYQKNLYDQYPFLQNPKAYVPKRNHYLDINSIIKKKPGTFVNEAEFFNEEPKENRYEFDGDCYLLINRDSYSAASSFASTFQCYQMGIIIGEETGGTKIFRANPIYELLPKTKLGIAMSTTKLYTTCYDKEFEGIKPTIEYSPSLLELTSDLDAPLYYAIKVIKKVQKTKQK